MMRKRKPLHIDLTKVRDPTELLGQLLTAHGSTRYRPPALPDTGLKLLELSRRRDAPFETIEFLINADAAISARVLSVAQSARYATRGGIRTLSDALVRLGLRQVVRIFLECVMKMRIYRAPGFDGMMGRLERHCTATGYIALELARHADVDANDAFLAGLLHDAGLASCLILMAPQRIGQPAPELAEFWPTLLHAHERTAEVLVKLWALPANIAEAISSHHGEDVRGSLKPLTAVVALADAMATDLGLSVPLEIGSQQTRRARKALDIDDDEFVRLTQMAVEACDHIPRDA